MTPDRRSMSCSVPMVVILAAWFALSSLGAAVRAADLAFASPRTVIVADEPTVLAFHVPTATDADRTFEAAVSDGGALRIVT